MYERPKGGERAVLVHLDLGQTHDEDLHEFRELAIGAGAEIVAVVTGARKVPEAKYFIGSGKAEEVAEIVKANKADLILINHAISPAQERNLELLTKCRVLDRTGLILDIFALRAQTFEGKLQVELAQLKHLSTRLVRGWTHLERQKGGIGLRGPGETQLEVDRRLIRKRMDHLAKRLDKVRSQRKQSRRARSRNDVPTISVVGYTNAGKSTLFNLLTKSATYTADQLFATLDPTIRRLRLPNKKTILLADTVGFIRHLPHDLVEAFRSTLEEARYADFMLHVIDAHNPQKQMQMEQVENVLAEIGAEQVPIIKVFNKLDLTENVTPRIERNNHGEIDKIWLSAHTGMGVELLLKALCERSEQNRIERDICLPQQAGQLYAYLHQLGAVREEHIDNNGNWQMTIELDLAEFNRLFESKRS